MSEATNNLLPPAVSPQAITFGRYFAKRAVIRIWDYEASDLTKAARAYLSEHPDLIQEAERTLAEWESSPRYRSFVESSATVQHRKARKPTP
jgi:hypothetical protein